MQLTDARIVLQEEKADPKADQYRIRSLTHAILSVQTAPHAITSGKEAIKVSSATSVLGVFINSRAASPRRQRYGRQNRDVLAGQEIREPCCSDYLEFD